MIAVNGKKRCSGCKKNHPATTEFFHRNNKSKDGLNPRCKKCNKGWAGVTVNRPTACASCGVPITQPETGGVREFCSPACQKTGRAFCKACGKPITQPSRMTGSRRVWCDQKCKMKYYHVGPQIKASLTEERARTECLVCGKHIDQPERAGSRKRFCGRNCYEKYRYTGLDSHALTEEWGAYGPETRKVLREVQQLLNIGAAKRVATAIDREYVRRKSEARP